MKERLVSADAKVDVSAIFTVKQMVSVWHRLRSGFEARNNLRLIRGATHTETEIAERDLYVSLTRNLNNFANIGPIVTSVTEPERTFVSWRCADCGSLGSAEESSVHSAHMALAPNCPGKEYVSSI